MTSSDSQPSASVSHACSLSLRAWLPMSAPLIWSGVSRCFVAMCPGWRWQRRRQELRRHQQRGRPARHPADRLTIPTAITPAVDPQEGARSMPTERLAAEQSGQPFCTSLSLGVARLHLSSAAHHTAGADHQLCVTSAGAGVRPAEGAQLRDADVYSMHDLVACAGSCQRRDVLGLQDQIW